MYLWTEFEGATIDSAFALTKLLQTEGRSAFFSTVNAGGETVLIRIIECHFDEDEILARWRGVQALGQPNFLRIDRFGQFHPEGEDGIVAVYAVFERVDANLGEVLKQGRLTAADATQIGLNVSSALESLHSNGFVHEHIEAGNIYAVGDNVKLRSDCIRESPEGEAGEDARRRDVQDLAFVLMNVLLGGQCDAAGLDSAGLPAPFDEIVSKGMKGSWGLAEIRAALGRRDVAKAGSKKTPRLELLPGNGAHPAMQASNGNGHVTAGPVLPNQDFKPERVVKAEPQFEQSVLPFSTAEPHTALPGQKRKAMELPVIFGISERDFRSWVTAVGLLLGVVLVGWIFLHFWFGHGSRAGSQAESSAPAIVSTPKEGPPLAAGTAGARSTTNAGLQRGVQWRVVAFTYSRQDQAQKKAASLAQRYPTLSPAVFSPNGRAPWLVTIGGALSRDEAYALARKAPGMGLPRDTYAQDYKGRE